MPEMLDRIRDLDPSDCVTPSNGHPVRPAPVVALRVNIGGIGVTPGFVNADNAVPLKIDGRLIPDGSVQEIRASHQLQQFHYTKTTEVLAEWFRVLAPGGSIRISAPNWDAIASMHLQGVRGLECYVMGDPDKPHGVLLNENKLRYLLRSAGFRRCRHWTCDEPKDIAMPDPATLNLSLNLEATKLPPVKIKSVKAVMSVPRYCISQTIMCAQDMSFRLHIPVEMHRGVYWHQTMTCAIEKAIADGFKYVLTIDYDSIYLPEDVEELYRLMEADPAIDALCATQMKRGNVSSILNTFPDKDGNALATIPSQWLEKDTVEARTAAFGLCLMRCDKFAKVARPWFEGKPDESGGWGDGRIDPDLVFWLKWREAGNSIHLAPLVPLGHLEETVKWADRSLSPISQDIAEWRGSGMPVSVIR